MQTSPRRNTLAILRLATGLTQKEFGTLVNRSAVTIQKIELGKLPLADSLGMEVAAATGVSVKWLMTNDCAAPMKDSYAKPYTRETFEKWRSQARPSPQSIVRDYFDCAHTLASAIALIGSAQLIAYRNKDAALLNYRIERAILDVVAKHEGYAELVNDWLKMITDAHNKNGEYEQVMANILREYGANMTAEFRQHEDKYNAWRKKEDRKPGKNTKPVTKRSARPGSAA